MVRAFVAFACGLAFALGLGVGGMTQPALVLAFLDVTGNWDPRLALVMLGAIAVYAPVYRSPSDADARCSRLHSIFPSAGPSTGRWWPVRYSLASVGDLPACVPDPP